MDGLLVRSGRAGVDGRQRRFALRVLHHPVEAARRAAGLRLDRAKLVAVVRVEVENARIVRH